MKRHNSSTDSSYIPMTAMLTKLARATWGTRGPLPLLSCSINIAYATKPNTPKPMAAGTVMVFAAYHGHFHYWVDAANSAANNAYAPKPQHTKTNGSPTFMVFGHHFHYSVDAANNAYAPKPDPPKPMAAPLSWCLGIISTILSMQQIMPMRQNPTRQNNNRI